MRGVPASASPYCTEISGLPLQYERHGSKNCTRGVTDPRHALLQCQMELGPGHINLINVYEAILTADHLAVVMEVAEGGSLTTYVAERWASAKPGGLILTEDEGRYFFRVRPWATPSCMPCMTALFWSIPRVQLQVRAADCYDTCSLPPS